jgi:hypothetical protein
MKHSNWCRFFIPLLIVVGLCMVGGCDSGEEVLDEATGNRAVKQYHQSKDDIEKIAGQQEKRLNEIPGDEKEDDENE